MIAFTLYAIFAICHFKTGALAGGWATDLGSVHYWFGLYIATDALGEFAKWVRS